MTLVFVVSDENVGDSVTEKKERGGQDYGVYLVF